MKRLPVSPLKSLAVLSLALVVLAGLFAFAKPTKVFEGTIQYSMSIGGSAEVEQMKAMMPTGYKMYIKGDQTRIDMQGGMAAAMMPVIVSKNSTGESFIRDDANKIIKTMDKPDEDAAADAKPTVKLTGNKETIAGHATQENIVTLTSGGQAVEMHIWVAPGFELPAGYEKNPIAKQWAASGVTGLPLRVTMSQSGMNLIIEATSVRAEGLNAELFSQPKGYKVEKFDMGGMGGE